MANKTNIRQSNRINSYSLFLAVFLLFTDSGYAELQDIDISSIKYEGFIQLRIANPIGSFEKPSGFLNSSGAKAGGETDQYIYLERAEFKLSSSFIASNVFIVAAGDVSKFSGKFRDVYAEWQLENIGNIRFGQFRIPFGIELQTSSSKLLTAERSILYGFGNFGYLAPLGFNVLEERDLGVRFDISPFSLAFVSGKSSGFISNSLMTDPIVRFDYPFSFGDLTVAIGSSAMWGRNKYKTAGTNYIPIGTAKDINSNPTEVITTSDYDERLYFNIYGLDFSVKFFETAIQAEWIKQTFSLGTTEGYSVTFSSGLGCIGINFLELVYRYEQVKKDWQDNIHKASVLYEGHTAGINLNLSNHWKLQLNYIILFADRSSSFYGSNVFIFQTQYSF